MATSRRINSWGAQCDSPACSSERQGFVANTPQKAKACKTVHRAVEYRQWSLEVFICRKCSQNFQNKTWKVLYS